MEAIKINNEFQVLQSLEFNKIWEKIPENSTFHFEIIGDKKYRSLQHNSYLWGVTYKSFIPANFQTIEGAHEYFTKRFLTHIDVIETMDDGFLKFVNEIKSKARKIVKFKNLGDRVEINWIRSTTDLSPKELTDYINQVQLIGNELGISFEQFDKTKNYGV